MDTCRVTGLPEASSNLLLSPHRYTSSKILRLDTRFYVQVDESNENEVTENSETLNSILHEVTKDNEQFALPDPELHKACFRKIQPDKITQNYFNRPVVLFHPEQEKMIQSKDLSMIDYTEKYKVTQKRKITNTKQSKDKTNKIVEARDSKERDVVLDLKYRISPPNPQDSKWCAGALALHIPHDNIEDLLTIDGERKTLIESYKYYHSKFITDINGQRIPLYPSLHKFEQNETDLYVATNATKHLPLHLSDKKKQSVPDVLNTLYHESEEIKESFESEEENFDPDEYSSCSTNASTNLKKENCKIWNGNPRDQFLSAENPWSVNYKESLQVNESLKVSVQHNSFMSLVLSGRNPNTSTESREVQQALSYANGDREEAAKQYLNRSLTECKNNEQRDAIKTVVNVMEAYYFGKYKNAVKVTKESVENTPIITMIGVPGAGKSWVINKIRTWISICFKSTDLPYKSSEFNVLNQKDLFDPVTKNIRESITNLPEGKYGKSVAFAFSGSAAGIVKGFTIHHGFSFPINMNRHIKEGELPLPELKDSIRTKLLECWCSVKLIIIDETYMLKVEWLSLIDERLRQIFNSNTPFAGIPILIAGDPRQIVPVNGKALFTISKYFNLDNTIPEPDVNSFSSLSEREYKGFLLYSSSKFAIPLTKSVRLSSNTFAKLNMKIAQYKVSPKDLKQINKFYRPVNALQESPWIDSPWLFPTWKEVNEHLQYVTERAKKHKGIFRAWCPVTIGSSQPPENTRTALRLFYQSSTFVSAKFTCPLPYIDYFIGQIVCLKKNWNPIWNLFNNAKAFVVGIKCLDPKRQRNPLMTLGEAIELNLESPEALKYSLLVKPLIPFTGPSAIPDVPGIIEVPWVKVNRKIAGCKMVVEGPCLFPANGFSQHQSQGSTFERCVSCINEKCKAYGMANVVTSRCPKPENFAISQPVTLDMLQPCPETSKLVENEYNRLRRKARKVYDLRCSS